MEEGKKVAVLGDGDMDKWKKGKQDREVTAEYGAKPKGENRR